MQYSETEVIVLADDEGNVLVCDIDLPPEDHLAMWNQFDTETVPLVAYKVTIRVPKPEPIPLVVTIPPTIYDDVPTSVKLKPSAN